MSKKTFCLILIIAFVFSVIFIPAKIYAAELKIGYVDTMRVLNSYNKTKDEEKVLEGKTNKIKEKRENMIEQIRKMKDELDILSENARVKKQTEIDEKMRELQDYEQQNSINLRRESDEIMREILSEIDKVIRKYAEDNGYTLILNNSSRFPVLLYGQKQYDLTDKILEILNSKYKK